MAKQALAKYQFKKIADLCHKFELEYIIFFQIVWNPTEDLQDVRTPLICLAKSQKQKYI